MTLSRMITNKFLVILEDWSSRNTLKVIEMRKCSCMLTKIRVIELPDWAGPTNE